MLPTGMILLWYGTEGTIPAGYVKCDGNNGTPNLEDKFIVGAGNSYAKDATGGAVEHLHNFTSNLHFHSITIGTGLQGGGDYLPKTDEKVVIGTTDNGNSLPPYHALFYIMKT